MSKLLRITFRTGDVRMGEMPNDRTLPQLWAAFRRDGAIMGPQWCAQFDHVAMIEVVEAAGAESGLGPSFQDGIPRLAAGMGVGAFKPPGEA